MAQRPRRTGAQEARHRARCARPLGEALGRIWRACRGEERRLSQGRRDYRRRRRQSALERNGVDRRRSATSARRQAPDHHPPRPGEDRTEAAASIGSNPKSKIMNALLTLLLASTVLAAEPPSLILHHGKIATVDKDFRIAEAIAIRGETIV